MTTALVTGAAGFAGAYLVEHLLEQEGVVVHAAVHGAGDVYAPARLGERVRLHRVDLADAAAARELVAASAPDFVFHLAAQTFVPASYTDPAGTLTTNVLLQVNLFEALRGDARLKDRLPRVLVVGSNEEYGLIRPADLPIREEMPFRPTSPYAVSKIAQDMLGLQYHLTYGLPVVRVRPFNHAGPRQSARFVVPAFARQIAEIEAGLREPVIEVGNLEARRDFTDVRDVVRAYRLAITAGTPGEVYNVGSGVSIPIRQILDWLIAECRTPVQVRQDPRCLRPSDVPDARCDPSKLRAATGWTPRIAFRDTVRETLEWWRAQVAPPGAGFRKDTISRSGG